MRGEGDTGRVLVLRELRSGVGGGIKEWGGEVTGSALGARLSATETAGIRVEIDRGVGRITLDRSPVNVVDIPMLRQLRKVLGEVRGDGEVRCVLLQGAGKCFCAGVDVADHTVDRVEKMLKTFHQVIVALRALPVPVVCAVHGAALGGGMEIAIACDVVIARDDATLGQPEIKLGVFPPAAAAILPTLIGRQRAMDLILSGRSVGAVEALAMGLVTSVFGAEQFAGGVEGYVARLASYSAPVLRLAKLAIDDGCRLGAEQALPSVERRYLTDLMTLSDPQEGLQAWIAKRPPTWRHA